MPKCKAKAKSTGNPCQRDALAGATVCIMHGGSAPQVREAARLRLLSLVDPAIGVLARATRARKDPKWEPSAQEISAAKEIIARTGVGEAERLAVTGTVTLSIADTIRARREARLKADGKPE